MDRTKVDDILKPAGPGGNARREAKVRAGFGRTLRRAASQIPFMDEVVAAYYCALDRRTPTRVRGILLAALAYFVLPTDAIPDILLGIGFTDDMAVLTAAITSIRPHIKKSHRDAAKAFLKAGS